MKWSPLQLNMLPIIAIETENAIKQYQSLTLKVSQTGNLQTIQLLNEYRQSIKKRVTALDRFYERKHNDDTISLFHMLKLKLQKTIYKSEYIQAHSTSQQMLLNLQNNIDDQNSSFKNNTNAIYHNNRSSPSSSRIIKTSKIPQKQLQVVKVKSISKQKNKQILSKRKLKTEYSNLHQEVPFGKQSSIYDYHNDTSYDDYQPLFKPDHQTLSSKIKNKPHQSLKPNYMNKQTDKKYNTTLNNKKQQSKPTTINHQSSANFNSKKPLIKNKQQQKNLYSTQQQHRKPKLAKQKQIHEIVTQSRSKSKQPHYGHPSTMQQKSVPAIKTGIHESQRYGGNRSLSSNILIKQQSPIKQQPSPEINPSSNQFRFTIKMNKQQYMSLLQMKKKLLKNNQTK